jgi:predicted transcriptional regulator
MTELMKQAVNALSKLSPDMQDELARMVLQAVGEDQPVIQLSPEEEASFEASLAQEDSGDLATEEEISALWAKHGL